MKIITRTVKVYNYTFAKMVESEGGEYKVEDVKSVSTYEPLSKRAIKQLTAEGDLYEYVHISTAEDEMKMACTLKAFMEIATPYEDEINLTESEDTDNE